MAFTCELCPTTFTVRTHLNRHVRTKHGKTSFKCERCDFTTNRKDNLKQHIESKHYGNQVKCSECEFRCNRKDSLNRHVKLYHPVDILSPTPNFDWVQDVENEEEEREEVAETRKQEDPLELRPTKVKKPEEAAEKRNDETE